MRKSNLSVGGGVDDNHLGNCSSCVQNLGGSGSSEPEIRTVLNLESWARSFWGKLRFGFPSLAGFVRSAGFDHSRESPTPNVRRSFKVDVPEPVLMGKLHSRGFRGLKAARRAHRVGNLGGPEIKIFSGAFVSPNKDAFLAEFCPWEGQVYRQRSPLTGEQQLETKGGFWLNSMFRSPAWNLSYFHWHRNFLTHLAFLLDQGFTDLRVVVDEEIPDYKAASLLAVGLTPSQIVPFSELQGCVVENLIQVSGLDRQPGSRAHDFVRPSALRDLATRVKGSFDLNPDTRGLKIYLRRGDVSERRVLNEDEVVSYLESNGGYQAVDPGGLTYGGQVRLFASASSVVGMHGGALTNLLFSSGPSVLEFGAAGHGLRPDFFPFARASGGHSALFGLPSTNPGNDVVIPESVLEWWLRNSELDSNYVVGWRSQEARSW